MKAIKRYTLILLSFVLISSCASRESIVYFQGMENFESEDNLEPIRFKSNDMLSIIVSAPNLESAIPFNLMSSMRPISGSSSFSSSSIMSSGTSQEVPYMVDTNGEIQFPILGTIEVKGMSTKELQNYLTERISEYVIDPIVNIRVLNFTFSVLGEVVQPGTFSVSGERIALPEALGLAGDLSIYGRRDNVLVVREKDGKKTYKYMDLRDSNILNSDYYYLQQHDIVYVEPNRAQRQASIFNRNISVYVSVASLLLTLYVIIDNK